MDANNHQRDTRQSGSPSCPDCIVDRKIERRALPESFSSNLGWKRPTPSQKVSDRSVRAMVNLFEKPAGASDSPPVNRLRLASGTSDTLTLSDGKGSHRDGHESINHDNKATRWPQDSQQKEDRPIKPESKTPSMFPSAQVGYQVEEYSLTLLKHKSYFNNRPLARCLDDDPGKNMETKIQRLKSRKGRAEETATEKGKMKRAEDGEEKKRDKDTVPPDRNETSSPVQQLDNLMSALLTWQGIPKSNTPELDHQWERRDLEEVNGFWRNVRKQLRVDEEEIYGERLSPPARIESAGVSMQRNGAHTLTPPTSASSIPASYHSELVSELPPPPMPDRLPPPIPAVPRGRSFSATSSQREQQSTTPSLEPFPGLTREYPAWDEPRPTSSVRLSISAGYFDTAHPLFDEYPEPELPPLPTPGRPLPIPPTQPSHSRYPSSSSSGPWTRPPTWRSPSTLRSSSPPRLPPLPTPIPTPTPTTPTNHPPCRHHRANHSRNRHQPHSSKTSASFSTTHSSVAMTDSSTASGGSRRMTGTTESSTTKTPKTSTSSTTTRSTRAGSSSTDVADVVTAPASRRRPSGTSHPAPPRPRRRLTAEEKLEEIDAFLSPEREVKGGWI